MDLNAIEKNLLKLDEYPVEKWNPKLCEGAEFKIDVNAHWYYNNSKIERASMVKLFSKLSLVDQNFGECNLCRKVAVSQILSSYDT